MPCLSEQLTSSLEALIKVRIAPVSADRGINRFKIFTALLDTGANRTCISRSIAESLALNATGKASMVSASHEVEVNLYMVDMLFPFDEVAAIKSGITVMEFNGSSAFQAIIGMDIISEGSFITTPDNKFTFCL